MEKFTFTNIYDIPTTIGYNNADFTLLEYEGLTIAEVIPVTHQGYDQYGDTVDKLGIGTRIITIRFLDSESNMTQIYQKRRNLAKSFNPYILGTLEYQNDYIDVVLDNVEVSVQPHPINRYGTVQEYEVELVAHNPWFRDTTLTEVSINAGVANLITYNGDIPAPWIIQFEVNSNTTLVNPLVYVSNSRISPEDDTYGPVYLNGSFTYTEENPIKYFGVCSAYGKKGYGDNLSHIFPNEELTFSNTVWTSKNIRGYSRFVDLTPGVNLVRGQASSGTPVSVKLKYYNQYAGV